MYVFLTIVVHWHPIHTEWTALMQHVTDRYNMCYHKVMEHLRVHRPST